MKKYIDMFFEINQIFIEILFINTLATIALKLALDIDATYLISGDFVHYLFEVNKMRLGNLA